MSSPSHAVTTSDSTQHPVTTSNNTFQVVQSSPRPLKRKRPDYPTQPTLDLQPQQRQFTFKRQRQEAFPSVSPNFEDFDPPAHISTHGAESHATGFQENRSSATDFPTFVTSQDSGPSKPFYTSYLEADSSSITASPTTNPVVTSTFEILNPNPMMSASYGPMHASPSHFLPATYQPYSLPALTPRPSFESMTASPYVSTGFSAVNSSHTKHSLERGASQKRRYSDRRDYDNDHASTTSPMASSYSSQPTVSRSPGFQPNPMPPGFSRSLYTPSRSPSFSTHYPTTTSQASGPPTYAPILPTLSSGSSATSYGYDATAGPQYYSLPHSLSYPPVSNTLPSNHYQDVQQPLDHSHYATEPRKAQCWEHGCNGRQFSTFSNLLRHQREKSGAATKSYCPRCGAEFTRTTARNGHMMNEKCKGRRSSDAN